MSPEETFSSLEHVYAGDMLEHYVSTGYILKSGESVAQLLMVWEGFFSFLPSVDVVEPGIVVEQPFRKRERQRSVSTRSTTRPRR
jgi:hypothetical protein